MKLDLARLPIGEMTVGLLIISLLVTFILAFTVMDSGTDATDEEVTDVPGTPISGGVDVVMGDNFFDPNDFTVAAGDTVAFNLTNEGLALHNMHIAQPDGNYSDEGICTLDGVDPCSDPSVVPGGQTAVLEWEVTAASGAVIPFRCDFHPVEMTGTLTIQ